MLNPSPRIVYLSRSVCAIVNASIIYLSSIPSSFAVVGAQIIFIHASTSDKKNDELLKLVDEITSRNVIPGIAVHNPVSTLEFALENVKEVQAFLVPFNARGFLMGNRQNLKIWLTIIKKKRFLV